MKRIAIAALLLGTCLGLTGCGGGLFPSLQCQAQCTTINETEVVSGHNGGTRAAGGSSFNGSKLIFK